MIKKDLVKKTTVIAITGALTVAMTAIVFAKPGGFENGMQGRDRMEDMRGGPNGNIGFDGDMSGMPGGGAPDGERPEITLGEVEDDDIGERGAGKDFNDGRPEMQGDEDINTYREAEKSAMEELRTALEEAGISTGQERPDGKEAGNDADNENTSKREMRQGDSTQQKQVPSEQGNEGSSGRGSVMDNSASGNILERIGNWLRSLFS